MRLIEKKYHWLNEYANFEEWNHLHKLHGAIPADRIYAAELTLRTGEKVGKSTVKDWRHANGHKRCNHLNKISSQNSRIVRAKGFGETPAKTFSEVVLRQKASTPNIIKVKIGKQWIEGTPEDIRMLL